MGIYLDNGATSYPKPEEVYTAVYDFMRNIGVSSGRGAYRQALNADRIVYQTRGLLAQLFNIRDVSRIVFTANVTQALNLAIKGILKGKEHVITTCMEHNAVWRVLKIMEAEQGIQLSTVKCAEEGSFNAEQVEKMIRQDTGLIVMLHASNVTGTIMPIREVGAVAREYNIPFLVDAAQTAGVIPIDVESDNIDMLAFTGHKGLMGPQGTGGLYIRQGIDLRPLLEGGTGGDSKLERQPDDLPDRYEAGTLNVSGIAGLGASVKFILNEGVEKIREHEKNLTAYALEKLSSIAGIKIYGPQNPERQTAVISLNFSDQKCEDIAYMLDTNYGIMVRAGLHCAPCAHRTINTLQRGTFRIGMGFYNTYDHIDCLVKALAEIKTKSGQS